MLRTAPSPTRPGVAQVEPEPLRPALKGGRECLSPHAAAEIQRLSGPRPGAFVLQWLGTWATIALAIWAALLVDAPWFTALAVLVVATRQMVLGLLVHEQAHRLGFRSTAGEWFVELTTAFPLLVLTVRGYAGVHLAHHRALFTASDPDFLRKSGTPWRFPKPVRSLLKLFATDASGLNTIALIRGKRGPAAARPEPGTRPMPRWVRPCFFLALAALLTWTQTWTVFLVFWVLPLLTVGQVLIRWGALCEHVYDLPGATVLEATPLIVLRWWERWLLPNLNFCFHPYHHFHPGVSFSNLPKVHEIYRAEGLVVEENVFDGYPAWFRYLTRPVPDRATGERG